MVIQINIHHDHLQLHTLIHCQTNIFNQCNHDWEWSTYSLWPPSMPCSLPCVEIESSIGIISIEDDVGWYQPLPSSITYSSHCSEIRSSRLIYQAWSSSIWYTSSIVKYWLRTSSITIKLIGNPLLKVSEGYGNLGWSRFISTKNILNHDYKCIIIDDPISKVKEGECGWGWTRLISTTRRIPYCNYNWLSILF